MTDQVQDEATAPLDTQKMIIIALVVVAALLAAIVGVMVYKANQTSNLPTATTPVSGGSQTGTSGAPAGMMSGATGGQSAAVAFDPKTATKVPKGTEPEAYVKQYYELCQKGDYAKAFTMLPKDKQATYGDAKAFESQVAAYGISGFELEKAAVQGDNASVTAWQKTPNGSFGYTWVLVKDNGVWLVKSRDMAGMK